MKKFLISSIAPAGRLMLISNCISFLGLIAGSCIFIISRSNITIHNESILLIASVFVIPNFKSGTNLTMIQKIVCLQLLFVIINQISNQYWQSPFIFQQIRISYSAIVLSFLAIAFVIEKMNSQVRLIDLKDKELFTSFLTAAGLIGLHILVLFYMLKKFYGYGYEHDLIVLGNLFLYLFLFLFIWQKLKQFRFRQLTAILLTFSLAAKIIISGLS